MRLSQLKYLSTLQSEVENKSSQAPPLSPPSNGVHQISHQLLNQHIGLLLHNPCLSHNPLLNQTHHPLHMLVLVHKYLRCLDAHRQ